MRARWLLGPPPLLVLGVGPAPIFAIPPVSRHGVQRRPMVHGPGVPICTEKDRFPTLRVGRAGVLEAN